MKHRKGSWLHAVAVLALSCYGCSSASVTVTALGGTNPVMFGPVKVVGAPHVAVAPTPTGGKLFDYRQMMQIWVLDGSMVFTTGTDNDWIYRSGGFASYFFAGTASGSGCELKGFVPKSQ